MVGQVNVISDNRKGNCSLNRYWYRQGVVNQIIEICTDYLTTHESEFDQELEIEQETVQETEQEIELEKERINPLFLPELIKNNGVELFGSSIQFFGNWQNALEYSGINEKVQSQITRLHSYFWTPETVLEQLSVLFNNRFDLSASFIKHVYPELISAASDKENFGSWSEVLNELEIDTKYLRSKTRRFWKPNKILTTIIDYEDAYGNIQPNFINTLNPSLYSSANRYFSSWSEAVQKAGLNITKNLLKVYLEPFRDYLVGEYLKNIFTILNIKFKEQVFEIEAENISEFGDLPKIHLIIGEGRSVNCIIPKYRSWCLGQNINGLIANSLTKYPRITFYHSLGEPRDWLGHRVGFVSLNNFYPELITNSRDDLVSELCLLARGGVPKQYQELFEKLMVEIKKIIIK